MELVIIVAVVVLVLVGFARLVRGSVDPGPPGETAEEMEARVMARHNTLPPSEADPQTGDHHPPKPSGEVFYPWGQPKDRVEVAGTSYRESAVYQVLRISGERTGHSDTSKSPAVLVPDPENPYSPSRQAIAVYVDGLHIGYVPESLARRYGRAMRALNDLGVDLSVPARTWIGDYGGLASYLSLPDPREIFPSNGLPNAPHAIIPVGKKRQVTKEENHLDVLRNYLISGGPNYVAVVLRKITDIRPRSAKDVVQVELDGQRVGVLSDAQSVNILPLVEYIEARGLLPVARAAVEGSPIKAEVVLFISTASEVSHEWLESLGSECAPEEQVIPGPDWDWDED